MCGSTARQITELCSARLAQQVETIQRPSLPLTSLWRHCTWTCCEAQEGESMLFLCPAARPPSILHVRARDTYQVDLGRYILYRQHPPVGLDSNPRISSMSQSLDMYSGQQANDSESRGNCFNCTTKVV